jgi:hypothetical protein
MVYLAGDNNLDSAGLADLDEMKQVGSSHELNVLAQFDRAGATIATKRYRLRRGTSLADDAVLSLGETNMGDPGILRDFIEWGLANYTAEHYLVVLWNHGNGWDDADVYRAARNIRLQVTRRKTVLQETDGPPRGKLTTEHLRAVSSRFRLSLFSTTVHAAVKARGIAYDDQAGDFLDNREIKNVFSQIEKKSGATIDILGMDACLMNMVEVAYQIRDCFAFVVGSEETEPGAGWPYHTILASLAANPATTPRALSALIVANYLKAYRSNANITLSALEQARVKELRPAVEHLGQCLLAGWQTRPTRLAIIEARRRAQHYYRPDYVDLADFCLQLKTDGPPALLEAACNNVIAAVTSSVVKHGSKGAAVRRSNGVSIYFPTNALSPLYATLDFAHNSNWARFIAAYQV